MTRKRFSEEDIMELLSHLVVYFKRRICDDASA